MEQRHLTSAMQLSEENQHQDPNGITAEWSYTHRGRVVAPENASLVYRAENVPTRGLYPATQYRVASRSIENSSSSLRFETSQVHAPQSAPSYNSLPIPRIGSFYTTQDSGASHSHSIQNNMSAVCEIEDGLLDHGMNTGRGQFKRKSSISLSCERGSTSSIYSAGSSSNSFEYLPDKPASGYPNYPHYTIGLPQYRGANLSVHSADHPRNVRSRSRTNLEPNPMTYPSSYSSHHYHPTTHASSDSGRANFRSFGAGTTPFNQNNIGVCPAHGRFPTSGNTGLRNETNQYSLGGSAVEVGGYRREPFTTAQYPHSLHDRVAMEVHGNYSQGAVPSHNMGVRSTRWPQEIAPTANVLPSTSEAYSSRFSRPFSARSWHNNHRETRSRIAPERFQSFPNTANARYRMQSEALRLEEHSFSYGSRNYNDEYDDMRLDVDNMSYEELLALGERIGNVNTGLPENLMSECLKETIYSSDKNQQEATCAICLEEYKNGAMIGTLRCRHDYHVLCIKTWLAMKNACPICKAPAVADVSNEE
ncbi:Zinc finger, RING-type [Corchorus capsularis]|uniref:RING-type E3 ubiquitin transferase n=1 Tax=Corchorus capsularis TaxID=210143 RepID=A0A1R3HMK2_COCAP|nr:Zinc finger, RING-type [Corchorus capsularis]